jgi:hypothetical protein
MESSEYSEDKNKPRVPTHSDPDILGSTSKFKIQLHNFLAPLLRFQKRYATSL